MNYLAIFLKSVGINLYGAKNPNMKQNPITKDYHIFLMSDVIPNSQESTAILIVEEGTYIWDKIDSHLKEFNLLAKFLFGIGVDLSGEEQPSIRVVETKSSKSDGKKTKSFDYHIFNYVASGGYNLSRQKNSRQLEFEEKNKAKPFLVIYEGTEHWYKIKFYLERLMHKAMNAKPIPFSYANL